MKVNQFDTQRGKIKWSVASHRWLTHTVQMYATVILGVCVCICVCLRACVRVCVCTYQSIPGKHLPSSAFLGCDESSIQPGRPVIHSFTSHRWPAIVRWPASSAAHRHTNTCTSASKCTRA